MMALLLCIPCSQHPTKDGSCIRDYVHVTDLVRAHIMTMDKLTNPPELFNIGSGNPVSVKEFVTACRNVTGKDIKVRNGCSHMVTATDTDT